MKFQPQRNLFTRPPSQAALDDAEDNGEDLPTPALLKANARRMAGIREAKQVLEQFPGPGESLHVVCTARMDVADLIACLLEKCGKADQVRIATLSYNQKNLRAMLSWLDAQAVGKLQLLSSIFFRSHKGALWTETLGEFRKRGQRAACAHSHAKVVTLGFANGRRLSIEGSANMCGNGSGREQFALINDPGLHDWHAAWIEEQVTRAEQKETDETAAK